MIQTVNPLWLGMVLAAFGCTWCWLHLAVPAASSITHHGSARHAL